MELREQHGSCIGNFCYERPEDVNPDDYPHRRIGALIYYRSHEAQVRLDLIPSGAWGEIQKSLLYRAILILIELVAYRNLDAAMDKIGRLIRDYRGSNSAHGVEWFIANFISSEKIPEPPYIDGDLFATTEVRGDHVFCGHIHTRQKASGETQYYMTLAGIPVREWIRIRDAKKEKKSIYLKVRL